MNITKIKLELSLELSRIPDFLLTTSSLDHAIWLNMNLCNDIFLSLISDKVLKPMTIKKKVRDFSDIVDSILVVIDKDRELEVVAYYEELESLLIVECMNNELYESLENIKIFNQLC